MDQPHRPQRSERKDPFPQIPFDIGGELAPRMSPFEGFMWGLVTGFAVTVLVLA